MNDSWEDLYRHMRTHHPEQFQQAVEAGNMITMRASGPRFSSDVKEHIHTIAAEAEVRIMRLLHNAIHEGRGGVDA